MLVVTSLDVFNDLYRDTIVDDIAARIKLSPVERENLMLFLDLDADDVREIMGHKKPWFYMFGAKTRWRKDVGTMKSMVREAFDLVQGGEFDDGQQSGTDGIFISRM